MTKLIEKALALVVSLTLISSISVNAYAATWSLYRLQGAPSSDTQTSNTVGVLYNSYSPYISEQCTSFASTEHSDGSIAYAKYEIYVIDMHGNRYNITSNKYHYQVSSSPRSYSLAAVVGIETPFTVYGSYQLMNYNGISSMIYGTLG